MPFLSPRSLSHVSSTGQNQVLLHSGSIEFITVYNSSVVILLFFFLLVDYKLFERKDNILFPFAYLIARFLELNIQNWTRSQAWDADGLGMGSG